MSPACAEPAAGPLRVSPDNPRYFADPTGKAVYLTGSHTWSNFKDMGPNDPPEPFDFAGYLEALAQYHHNFIRLWHWELSRYSYSSEVTYCRPFPWPRTGPGKALDGRPRFDLDQFDQAYFDRLRQRVQLAGKQGVYVSIMLFEGHGLHASEMPWCWHGHPMHPANNVNGLDGDPNDDGRGLETQSLSLCGVTAVQEAYVRKVVDTVNDLDNVLYEIANESGGYSTRWQYHLIDLIHDYEADKPKQHPVGMTFQYCDDAMRRGKNRTLFDSAADWISPNPEGGYCDDPPAGTGAKVILSDTDHLWGIGGSAQWVWKSFCRGLNPIFMDPWYPASEAGQETTWTDHLTGAARPDARWDPIRQAMGQTLRLAQRIDLRHVVPHGELCSSGYCLADPQSEYVVYLPDGGQVTVDLTAASAPLTVEWIRPAGGDPAVEPAIEGGARRQLRAPFPGDAVVYLKRAG